MHYKHIIYISSFIDWVVFATQIKTDTPILIKGLCTIISKNISDFVIDYFIRVIAVENLQNKYCL